MLVSSDGAVGAVGAVGQPQLLDTAQIVVERLATGERTVLVEEGYDGRYLETGHLLYGFRDTLNGGAVRCRTAGGDRRTGAARRRREPCRVPGRRNPGRGPERHVGLPAVPGKGGCSHADMGRSRRHRREPAGPRSVLSLCPPVSGRHPSGPRRARRGERPVGLASGAGNADAIDVRRRIRRVPSLDAGRAARGVCVGEPAALGRTSSGRRRTARGHRNS